MYRGRLPSLYVVVNVILAIILSANGDIISLQSGNNCRIILKANITLKCYSDNIIEPQQHTNNDIPFLDVSMDVFCNRLFTKITDECNNRQNHNDELITFVNILIHDHENSINTNDVYHIQWHKSDKKLNDFDTYPSSRNLLTAISSNITWNDFITSTISLPTIVSDREAGNAIGYDHYGFIWIIGGVNSPYTQVIQYVYYPPSDSDYQEFNYDSEYLSTGIYGTGQFYTTINNVVYMINNNGNQLSTFDMIMAGDHPSSHAGYTYEYNDIPIYAAGGACLSSVGNYLFVVGGATDSIHPNPINTFQILDISTQEWLTDNISMNSNRNNHVCTVHPEYNELYAISGWYLSGETSDSLTNTIEKIDVSNITNSINNEWEYIDDVLIEAVAKARTVIYENYILIIGGYACSSTVLSSSCNNPIKVQLINILNDKVSYGPSLSYSIFGAASISVNNRLYVFGGWTGAGISDVNTWQYADLPPTPEPTVSPTEQTSIPSTTPTLIPTSIPTNHPTSSSPTLIPTQNVPSPSPTPTITTAIINSDIENQSFFQKYVRNIIYSAFIGLIIIVCMIIIILSKCKNDKFLVRRFVNSMFHIIKFLNNIFWLYGVLDSNSSSLSMINILISISFVIFIIAPSIFNTLQTHNQLKEWTSLNTKNQIEINKWFFNNSYYFYIICFINANGYTASQLFTSSLFGMKLFSLNLTQIQLALLKNKMVDVTTLFQNVPHLTLQLFYAVNQNTIDSITIISALFNLLSIILTVLSCALRQNIIHQGNKQLFKDEMDDNYTLLDDANL